MKLIYSLICFLVFNLNTPCFAHTPKEGKILLTGGPYIHQTHVFRTQDTVNSPFLAGIGFLLEGDTYDKGGIEIGLFYFHKTFLRGFGTTHIVEKVHKIAAPFSYRHWITDYLSMGLGFTTSFSNGESQVIYNDVVSGEGTSAREIGEYSIDYSVQYEMWRDENKAVVLDGRYAFSLSPKPNEDANHYGFLIGLKYLIQEK